MAGDHVKENSIHIKANNIFINRYGPSSTALKDRHAIYRFKNRIFPRRNSFKAQETLLLLTIFLRLSPVKVRQFNTKI